jgi:hypothetical protein
MSNIVMHQQQTGNDAIIRPKRREPSVNDIGSLIYMGVGHES